MMVHPTVSHRVSRWQLSLHRPVTSERAIGAGPISDVPYVCNNGRDGAVDGRQPFLPVGVPAVNSGSVLGAAPCLALWRPPAAGGPAALCGSWLWQGSGQPGAAPLQRLGRRVPPACFGPLFGTVLPRCGGRPLLATGAFQLRYARGPQSCSRVRQQLGTG